MTGTSSTRPISKNIGSPISAPTAAIVHGSIRRARPVHERVHDLVGAAAVEQELAEHRAETHQQADAGHRRPEAGAEADDDVVEVLPGDHADGERTDEQRDDRMDLEGR